MNYNKNSLLEQNHPYIQINIDEDGEAKISGSGANNSQEEEIRGEVLSLLQKSQREYKSNKG